MKPLFHAWSTLLLSSVVALAMACGGDDDSSSGSSKPQGSPDWSPTSGGIEAIRRYLPGTGLDGKKGELTEPFDCAKLPDGDSEGTFCIVDSASVYAPGLVILNIARVDSAESGVFRDAWRVHLNPGEAGWEVTQVEDISAE